MDDALKHSRGDGTKIGRIDVLFTSSTEFDFTAISGNYMTIKIVTFLAKKINISLNGKNYSNMM